MFESVNLAEGWDWSNLGAINSHWSIQSVSLDTSLDFMSTSRQNKDNSLRHSQFSQSGHQFHPED